MSALRMVDITGRTSVDPVEVIGLHQTSAGNTRILLYAGEVTVPLSIDRVRQILRGET